MKRVSRLWPLCVLVTVAVCALAIAPTLQSVVDAEPPAKVMASTPTESHDAADESSSQSLRSPPLQLDTHAHAPDYHDLLSTPSSAISSSDDGSHRPELSTTTASGASAQSGTAGGAAQVLSIDSKDPAASAKMSAGFGKTLGGRVQTRIPPRPVLLIPGQASSQLFSWSSKTCDMFRLFQGGSTVTGFSPGDRVWLDTAKLVAVRSCWLDCIRLDPRNQTDGGCRVRPGMGISAIGQLDPGIITGPLSTVWDRVVKAISAPFDYDPTTLFAAPFDFRLPPCKLEERDHYFSQLKLDIETIVSRHPAQRGIFVVAHSLGNVVFRYFLQWLKRDVGENHHQEWIDKHIHTYMAAGAAWLGAPEAVRAVLSGENFGMPVSLDEIRTLATTFGSAPWSFTLHEERALPWSFSPMFRIRHSPADLLNSPTPFDPHNLTEMFDFLNAVDPHSSDVLHQLQRFYLEDPVGPIDGGWDRPPVHRVICAYGVNLKTEIGYTLEWNSPRWHVADKFHEHHEFITDALGNIVKENAPGTKSGDGTIPYSSLSWCRQWLGPEEGIRVTRLPQRHFDEQSVEPREGENVITFLEADVVEPGRGTKHTAVWEIDAAHHREVIYSPPFLRELREELYHDVRTHEFRDGRARKPTEALSPFAQKRTRVPTSDDDCWWDYGRVQCAWPTYCQYNYKFGDFHLDQSCRLKPPSDAVGVPSDARCTCGSECVEGFCRYRTNCEHALQPFGPENGWWGPCEVDESEHLSFTDKLVADIGII